jgi:hypothetical protein
MNGREYVGQKRSILLRRTYKTTNMCKKRVRTIGPKIDANVPSLIAYYDVVGNLDCKVKASPLENNAVALGLKVLMYCTVFTLGRACQLLRTSRSS